VRAALAAAAVALLAGAAAGAATSPPQLPGAPACPIFPASNSWNQPVGSLPVAADSATLIRSIGLDKAMHADFGSGLWDGGPIGIPFTVVAGTQRKVSVSFDYADESDRGPYPIPKNVPIEGGSASTGDRHALIVDRDRCKLYELYSLYPVAGGGWKAGSGAIWDLRSNALRPKGGRLPMPPACRSCLVSPVTTRLRAGRSGTR
jgi:hypothetical protein